MNMTVQLRKKQKLGFFALLNEGTEEIRHKFTKQRLVNDIENYKIYFPLIYISLT